MGKQLYFSHDFNAGDDPKIQAMLMDLGAEGYGIYWSIVEQLYKEDGILHYNSIRCIAYKMHVSEEKVQAVIENFDLFEVGEDEKGRCFWSTSQLERQNKMKEVLEKRRSAGLSSAYSKANAQQMFNKCSTNAQQVLNKCSTNVEQVLGKIKEKENKKENIKEEDKEESSAAAEALPLLPLESDGPLKPSAENYDWVKDSFNEVCTEFPKVVALNQKRRQKLKMRLGEMSKLGTASEIIASVFVKMQASDFLKGKNDRGWKANFDWVIENPTNWVKVYEGNYDNRAAPTDIDKVTGMKAYKNEDYWK